MPIIGLSGKKFRGKTTAAKYLERYYGFTRLSFATPLRDIAVKLFDFSEDELTTPKKKEAPFRDFDWSPRDFMVNLGAFLRYHDPDYFVNLMEENLEDLGPKAKIVIDDLRFPNEAEMLTNHKATLVRLNRYAKDCGSKDTQDDSEIGLDGYQHFDYVIHEFDNKTVRILTDKLDHVMEDLGYEAED